jgi:hypothetical protein
MKPLEMDGLSFTFPASPGLEKVRTGIVLDARGAKLTVVGLVPCRCRCHDQKVVIQYVMKGRGNEDRLKLGLVERMIRGSCPLREHDAAEAAKIMTTLLVNDHLNRSDTDTCEGVPSGEAA